MSYETDKLSLLNKFNEVGLRDAEIVFDTVYQIDDKNLVIDLTINEGENIILEILHGREIPNIGHRISIPFGGLKGDLYNKSL